MMTASIKNESLAADMTSGTAWSEQSDETLLLEYRTRATRPAFDELVHRYEREIYSYLRRYLGQALD